MMNSLSIRRYQESDFTSVNRIYKVATYQVICDGLTRAFLDYTSILGFSLIIAYCLLRNYWYISISIILVYLALPSLVALISCLKGLGKDLDMTTGYFSTPKTAFFVATLRDEDRSFGIVVGMVGIKLANTSTGGKFAGLRRVGDAELVRMNLDPEYQGLGISHQLMMAAINFSTEQGYKRIILTSSSLQHVATKILYPKYGFVFDREQSLILGIKPCFMSKLLTNQDNKLK